jgi:DNA-binding NtrC family response regulator
MPRLLETERLKTAGRIVLLAADTASTAALIAELDAGGFDLCHAATPAEFCDWLDCRQYEAAVVDWRDAGVWPADFAARLGTPDRTTQFVWRGAPPELNPALMGLAFARLEANCSASELQGVLDRAVAHCWLIEENRRLKRRFAQYHTRAIVGHGPLLETLRQQLSEAAAHDLPVLFQGEHGTGKDLSASVLHEASERAYRPLIKVHCGLLTSESLERELFGCQPGVCDESPAGQSGRLESADGGTLLLKDIAEIPFQTQARLLRAFETGQFEKQGARETTPFNVRLLATSSVPLAPLVAKGHFRQDLQRFLSQTAIQTPPLRVHPEDLSQLAEHFLYRLSVREGRPVRRLPLDALQLFRDNPWPGNVRQLENLIDRACALDSGSRLTAEMIRPWLLAPESVLGGFSAGLSLKDLERKLIESTFARLGGNRERTAAELQIGIRTLSGKLREYGYPPRGGPGSNLKRLEIQQRAA